MILVLCGTQKQQFSRIIEMAELLYKFDNEIIVQNGHTKYESNKVRLLDFISSEKLENYYEKADIILTHGGTGSIMTGIRNRKPVIAVPRLEKFHEHVDDHQTEIVHKLSELGYIISCNSLIKSDIVNCYNKAMSFQPNNDPIYSKIHEMISTILNKDN
ncbi:glycosyltransferase [Senegalia massiliensis]|uniref:glycosyltransferase n=1 Tax=Senegalia massiliensis TaxID=1720316 RepID=UPI001362687F|nr:glycosyltransferase [Senegalia massiliensis]